jgi:hypothetical protein
MLIGKLININTTCKRLGIIELTLSVQRPFREMDGTFKCDEFTVSFFNHIFDDIIEELPLNNTLIIKGRLAMIKNTLTIVGENILLSENRRLGNS